MVNQKIVVLLQMHGGLVNQMLTFTGEEAEEAAENHFQIYTGISYKEYSEDSVNLSAVYEGTEIYCTTPNEPLCASEHEVGCIDWSK